MTDPSEALQQILAPGSLGATLFSPTSRYYGIETATLETADGDSVTYVKRRFLPSPDRFALLQEHVVSRGDRLDNIAARYFGDPEQFWRIADANAAMQPEGLIQVGRRLRITLPEGLPGMQNA
jgi:nucleoid-associated protein YgaU